jgi:hypothetical protein
MDCGGCEMAKARKGWDYNITTRDSVQVFSMNVNEQGANLNVIAKKKKKKKKFISVPCFTLR